MITLTGETVADLFEDAVDLAMDGDPVSPRRMATREVLDVGMVLQRPRARLVVAAPARVLNPAFAVAESVWALSGSDDAWIFEYNARLRQFAYDGVLRGAYGPRMRRWGGVDQLRRVVDILTADPDSRRAMIQLYDPARDAAGHKDVPCTLNMRFYLRGGRLHVFTAMRGQDVWIGLPYDLFFYTTVHELVAGWLGVELGEFHHHVGSLHIYERDVPSAEQLTYAPPSPVMPPLATEWDGFDDLLALVRTGQSTGHAGWDAMGQVLRSYRVWKTGDHRDARDFAADINAPLGEALLAWYDELARRAEAAATPAAVGR